MPFGVNPVAGPPPATGNEKIVSQEPSPLEMQVEQPKADVEKIDPMQPVVTDFSMVSEPKADVEKIDPMQPVVTDFSMVSEEKPKEAPVAAPKPIKLFGAVDPKTGEEVEFKNEKEMTEFLRSREEEFVRQGGMKTGNALIDNWAQMLLDPEETAGRIKETTLNNFISTMGPQNQAALDQLNAYIKRNNLQGTGTGNALLLGLSRATNTNMAQMVGKLNQEEAERILAMNEKGGQFGLTMRNQYLAERYKDLDNDIKLLALQSDYAEQTGDYSGYADMLSDITGRTVDADALKERWQYNDTFAKAADLQAAGLYSAGFKKLQEIIPTTPIDEAEFYAMNPARKVLLESRMESVRNATSEEDKRAAMMELARDFPEVLGFSPDRVDEAVEMVSQMDFKDFDNLIKTSEENTTRLRGFARTLNSGKNVNWDNVDLVGYSQYESDGDAQVKNKYDNRLRMLNAGLDKDVIDKVLKTMGLTSTDEIDTREEMVQFMARSEVYQMSKDFGTMTEEIFNQYRKEMLSIVPDEGAYGLGQHVTADEIASWLTDPDLTPVTNTWIAELHTGTNWEYDEENGRYQPKEGAMLPPWVEGSPLRYRTLTWGNFYDAEGNLLSPDDPAYYAGGEVYGLLDPNDAMNSADMKLRREKLVKDYTRYKNTTGDDALGMKEWMIATKAGTPYFNPTPNEELLAAAREQGIVPPEPEPTDFDVEENEAKLIKSFRDKARAGKTDEMTTEEVLLGAPKIAPDDLPFGDISGWKSEHTKDSYVVNVDGVPMKVLKGHKFVGDNDIVLIEMLGTGKKFWRDENDNWFPFEEGKLPYREDEASRVSRIGGIPVGYGPPAHKVAVRQQDAIATDFEEFKKYLYGTPEDTSAAVMSGGPLPVMSGVGTIAA